MPESRLERVSRWCDPQWLLLTAVLLAPALVFALAGRTQKASFFLGLAVYVASLRWVGWVLFTRHLDSSLRYLLFVAEVLLGLAVVVLWFYIRNLLGLLAPGAYCLCELKILSAAVLAANLVAAVYWFWHAPRPFGRLIEWLRNNLPALTIYAIFGLTLFAALYSVSGARHVQSSDPLYHAFTTRVYVNDGMFLSRFNGGNPLIYPSGFGAMNAITVALSNLTPVQAVNLQHVLWNIGVLFLITCGIAWQCRRPLPLLHCAVPIFLLVYPQHNLPPMKEYQHTPRQAAAPLLLAIVVLPLLLRARRTSQWLLLAASVLVLCALTVLLNPSSAPFTAVAAIGAAIVLYRQAVNGLSLPPARALLGYFGLAALVILLTFCADRYYAPLLTGARPRVDGQVRQAEPIAFSSADGATHLSTLPVLRLQYNADQPLRREDYLPLAALIGCALALVAAALPLPDNIALRRLAYAAAGALVLSGLTKFATGYLAGGLVPNSWDMSLMKAYLGWTAIRLEMLLLFGAVVAGGAAVFLAMDRLASLRIALASAVIVVCAALIAVYPSPNLLKQAALTKLKIFDFAGMGLVADDDLKLTKWIDANIPPEKGLIGLAAFTMAPAAERHIYPLGGPMALPLYGKHYNFVFFQAEPSRGYSFDDYVARVKTRFDATWLLDNGIVYFYVARNSLYDNDGLKRALENGTLQPVMIFGESGLYAITPK